VAAGCVGDPEKNDHGRAARSSPGDHVDVVTNAEWQIHRRVKVDPQDIPRIHQRPVPIPLSGDGASSRAQRVVQRWAAPS
jgi:hypothetical protein